MFVLNFCFDYLAMNICSSFAACASFSFLLLDKVELFCLMFWMDDSWL